VRFMHPAANKSGKTNASLEVFVDNSMQYMHVACCMQQSVPGLVAMQ
jgi:hypothetical protein